MAEWYPGDHERTYMNMMPDLESLNGAERDEAFLQGMIEHHAMAVDMAEQVLELDPREEVASFARDVIRVQNSEIEEMKGMLE